MSKFTIRDMCIKKKKTLATTIRRILAQKRFNALSARPVNTPRGAR